MMRSAFENIGSLITYRFSLLPKWIRASVLALTLVVIMGAICITVILVLLWVIQTFGGEVVVIATFTIALFLVVLSHIWDGIPDDKRKNGE